MQIIVIKFFVEKINNFSLSLNSFLFLSIVFKVRVSKLMHSTYAQRQIFILNQLGFNDTKIEFFIIVISENVYFLIDSFSIEKKYIKITQV